MDPAAAVRALAAEAAGRAPAGGREAPLLFMPARVVIPPPQPPAPDAGDEEAADAEPAGDQGAGPAGVKGEVKGEVKEEVKEEEGDGGRPGRRRAAASASEALAAAAKEEGGSDGASELFWRVAYLQRVGAWPLLWQSGDGVSRRLPF
jgi:hypothetical protein